MESKRILLWGLENHLESLYRICDVYLQPNRNGGGVSIRQAMREGLPIVLTDYPSDILAWMDEQDVIYGDYLDLMNFVSQLYHNEELYKKCSNRMLELIEKFSPENDTKKVLKVCELAIELFQHQKERM